MAVKQSTPQSTSTAGRRFLFGTNVLILVFLAAFVTVGVNWLAYRYNSRKDLAGDASFRVSERTKRIIDQAQTPFRITTVYTSDEPGAEREEYLGKLQDYCQELARRVGPFHTKGLPADTKALDQGVLSDDEFLAQDEIFLEEKQAIYEHELSRFESGLLFYYMSSTDQRAHMFWRLQDPGHPAYDEKAAAKHGQAIEKIYKRMDALIDKTLATIDDRTVLVAFSDHGFAPYYRSFNLNTWLRDQGFIVLKDREQKKDPDIYGSVDWSRTKAYAMGFNSLYVNEKGREGYGSVSAGEKKAGVEVPKIEPKIPAEIHDKVTILMDRRTRRRATK